jgi:hypothetical protein
MISSDSNGNLTRHATFLAAGIGLGVAAMVAHNMYSGKGTKKEVIKKDNETAQNDDKKKKV